VPFEVGTEVYLEDSPNPYKVEQDNGDRSYQVRQGTGDAKTVESILLRPIPW